MKDIGGYIELEINSNAKSGSYHPDALALNSGRNGLAYAIKAFDIKELWVPYYTCPVVWDTIKNYNCNMKFYSIDQNLMPAQNFGKNDFILYTNYYGTCNKNINMLEKQYNNLIIDNAQGFYAPPKGIATIYSPRKFFGVPDGGYVYSNRGIEKTFEQDRESYNRFSHLLMRIEDGAEYGYNEFNKNEDSLIGAPIKLMSNLTSKLLAAINYEKAAKIRIRNFKFLDKYLKKYNKYKLDLENNIPQYYPFLIEYDNLRQELIKNKIYIPNCWRNIEQKLTSDMYEYYIKKYTLPLIIDQRYDLSDMKRIIDVIMRVI